MRVDEASRHSSMRGQERGSKERESKRECKGRESKREQVKREDERGSWLYDVLSQLRGVKREQRRTNLHVCYQIKREERRNLDFPSKREASSKLRDSNLHLLVAISNLNRGESVFVLDALVRSCIRHHIRQHTSAFYSIPQHTSAYVSIQRVCA